MTTSPEGLERALRADLGAIEDRFTDSEFCEQLYRALANRTWVRAGQERLGHVVLSRQRAEDLIDDRRRSLGMASLGLAQTSGEGFVSQTVLDVLEDLGWVAEPLDAARGDAAHFTSPHGVVPGS